MPGIDLHTHLAPCLDDCARDDDGLLLVDGHPVGPPDLYRPDRLEEYLGTAELDEAIVTIPPPFYRQDLSAGHARDWVEAVNEGLLRALDGRDRLTPLAYLPLEHPEAALAEYTRLRDDERWAGLTAAVGGRSASLADPALAPLWETLDDDGRTLLLHPATTPDARLTPFYLTNLLGNPAETALGAAQLVFGDVLARHTRMRFVLVHCGGLLPAVVGRWQRGVETRRPGVPELTEPPRQAVRRFYVDCLAHDPATVDLAVTTFGEDRVVLGSDWPFAMGTRDPRSLVVHRGEEFTRRTELRTARSALGRPAAR
ncbi:amidohydrolase family protein [Streptomyces sp. SS]|uniref:amidohydrolase family protein n=1 Tax=Streptomyces sp. SS TaxID=260742 RepID=UPI0002ECA271|nr:amidohydrolase family protein [Streptomyces sp. SS]